MRQEIRFCTAADGVRIALATHGNGRPIVRASTWPTHLELDWQSPVWRHWLEGLAEGHTLVRYDERTVERHLSNIYAKLGVSGKAARAAAAVRFSRSGEPPSAAGGVTR